MIEVHGKYTNAKIMIDDVEPECMSQIHHFTNHLAFTNPVAIMPDCHSGKGSVIGFTMPMTDKVIPNVVGVDIGCGILSVNFGKDLGLSLEMLDHKIRQRVPFGAEVHENSAIHMKNDFPWNRANVTAQKFAAAYRDKYGIYPEWNEYDMDWFMHTCEKRVGGGVRRIINSLGTLGGGNHFIETGVSESGDHWITIHTGSRNFGKRVCEYWQGKAVKWLRKDRQVELRERIEKVKQEEKDGKEIYRKIKEIKQDLKLDVGIDMKGCEWLEGEMATGYLFDMIFAQTYAEVNREYICRIIQEALKIEPLDKIETVHNFIDFHDWVIRKGAIRSYVGERMIIPFNMRDGILVCEGKSNEEWNCSAPHGAGRVMSRAKAKKTLNTEDFQKQMDGIYSTSVGQGTLDEAPDAYKDSTIIEIAIEPTAAIVDRLKPIHNMKDAGGMPSWKKKKEGLA